MVKSIVDKLFENKLQEAENLQIEYKGYTIYDTLPKYVSSEGDLEIRDSDGDIVAYAGDENQAKSIIDKLAAPHPRTATPKKSEEFEAQRSKPYFVYRMYKNNPNSPTYYWNATTGRYETDLKKATFYRIPSEAKDVLKRAYATPAMHKYYYLVGDLNDTTKNWKSKYIRSR